jgi:uncharacterized protein (UPF0332 family)
MAKAGRALASAQLLIEAGDPDGACNRLSPNYAMFDAAKAALQATDAPHESLATKTHSGLIAAFSLHVVKRGLITADLGRAFNRLHELRMIADYRGDSIDSDSARQTYADASAFVAAVAALLDKNGPAPHSAMNCN